MKSLAVVVLGLVVVWLMTIGLLQAFPARAAALECDHYLFRGDVMLEKAEGSYVTTRATSFATKATALYLRYDICVRYGR